MRSSACSRLIRAAHCQEHDPAPTGVVWMLRDFNGRPLAPAVATSTIERAQAADRIGCVRRWAEGRLELRENCWRSPVNRPSAIACSMPIPISYVAHVRLLPVTDGDRTFWHWESRFTTRPADAAEITEMVGEQIYQAGFEAIRRHLQGAA